MTTPTTNTLLRELHRLRRHSKDLQEQSDRLPRQQKIQQAKVAHQEKLQSEAQETLKKTKVRLHEREVTLKNTLQLVAKHEKQLREATGKKEYDALQIELTNEKKQVATLEEEILLLMTEIEERTSKLPEFEKNVKSAKDEFKKFEAERTTRQAELQGMLAKCHSEIAELDANLPLELKQTYGRLIAAKGDDGIAGVQGRTCTACHTEVTAQVLNDFMSNRIVYCKSCGRILYQIDC